MQVVFKNEDLLVLKQEKVTYDEEKKLLEEFSGYHRIDNIPETLYIYPAKDCQVEWFHVSSDGRRGPTRYTIYLTHEAEDSKNCMRYVAKCRDTTFAFNGATLEPCDVSDIKSSADVIRELATELFSILRRRRVKIVKSEDQTLLINNMLAMHIGCADAYKMLEKRGCITKTGTLTVTLDDILFMILQESKDRREDRLQKIIKWVQ